MSNTTKIMVDARKFAQAIDIMNAVEKAGVVGDITSIDITEDQATIMGDNLSRLGFTLTGMGYLMSLGPNKTHLFVSMKEAK